MVIIIRVCLLAITLPFNMLVNFIKFIHLLLTLGLLGSASYCLTLIGSKTTSIHNFIRLNQIMLLLCILAMLTGTFLVIPKQFTFHTPWIQAAYLLLLVVGLGIFSIVLLKKKRLPKKTTMELPRTDCIVWRLAYFVLILLLIGIIHDAVTKTTFIF